MQRNGRVNSGDVSLFYRAFGARGRTPILLMHGTNYFDSYDWIGVAEALASDREVASFDKRGFGETGWSPSKDYSVDANMGDMLAVIAELKWERPIVVGHSASGRLSISFAANFPDKISRLVVVDSGLAREEGGGARPAVGNPPLVFETVEAAMAHFAKLSNPPRISHDRERALAALVKVEKGYMLKRDPDFQNTKPQGEGANLPQRAPRCLAGARRRQVPDHDRARVALGPLHARDHRAHFARLSQHRMGDGQFPARRRRSGAAGTGGRGA